MQPKGRKETKKMEIGFFQKLNENFEVKTYRNVKFENTGAKFEDGKVIWRKLNKDGTPSNVFAEQFRPDTPWASGKWFCKVNAAQVLAKYPQLKVETERSKTMTEAEYLNFLNDTYYC